MNKNKVGKELVHDKEKIINKKFLFCIVYWLLKKADYWVEASPFSQN
jgi:hypothetical protein